MDFTQLLKFRKLLLQKFPGVGIRWNYGIFCSVALPAKWCTSEYLVARCKSSTKIRNKGDPNTELFSNTKIRCKPFIWNSFDIIIFQVCQ